ncbi:MAG: 3-keto-5-aminohexanoate cleavage protein, partial [Myxococcales bacterium]|nr:3-keto-5-aminohexanoate cleavage protein [Myxococcales bacterium]
AYADAIRAVRSVCDLPILPTLGATTLQDPVERVQHILELAKDPATCPELAPVDLASTNLDPYRAGRGFLVEDEVYINSVRGLRTQIAEIRGAGVAVHAVLWNVGSARLLGAFLEMKELEAPLSVELVLSDQILACHPATHAGLDALLEFLPGQGALPWLALCAGGSALSLIEAVVERGGHLSLGLGDWHYPELGRPTNAELIDHVVERVRGAGGEPASSDEARELLGLRP